jgi:hypothetical protein
LADVLVPPFPDASDDTSGNPGADAQPDAAGAEVQRDAAGADASPDAPDATPGCPSSVTWGAATQTPLRSAMASPVFNDSCPTGQVVVGYWLDPDTGNNLVGKIATRCGTLSVDTVACRITIGPGASLPTRGIASSNTPVTLLCPSDQMVVGLKSRSGSFLDQVEFGCAALNLSLVGSTYQLTVGAITWLTPLGGNGGSAAQDTCPSNQVVTGTHTEEGGLLTSIALLCSRPTPVP